MIPYLPKVTQLVSGRPQSLNHYPKLTHTVGWGHILYCSGPRGGTWCPLRFPQPQCPGACVSGRACPPGVDTTHPVLHPGCCCLHGAGNGQLTPALSAPASQAACHPGLARGPAPSPLPTRRSRRGQNPWLQHRQCMWPRAGGAGALWEIPKLERRLWLWGTDQGQCGWRVWGEEQGNMGEEVEREGRGQIAKGFMGSS